ncbi:MAG: cytochrome c-type biogenesis protein [Gaiellaceae bacterium]
MRRALVLVLVAAAVVAVPAPASEERPTPADIENEVVCPTCHTTIDQSNAPIALRMKAFIRERIAAGDTKSEIKGKLVAQFGESVLAAPPRSGFNLLAWLLPLVGAGVGAAVLAILARRWRRLRPEPPEPGPSSNGRAALTPDLDRRVDEELARFDA